MIVDNYTNLKVIYPTPTATEEFVIKCLQEYFRHCGLPLSVRGDNAHNITGKIVE